MVYRVYNDQYIAAIIKSPYDLGQWLIKVPKERLETLRIDGMHTVEGYPFQLAECKLGPKKLFIPVGKDHSDVQALKNIGLKILTIYTITEDFPGNPFSPGLNYMGLLDHKHEEEHE